MPEYNFGALFAGMTRVEIVPRYRLNREAPADERVSFVVEAPTVGALAEWQSLAEVAAAVDVSGDPSEDDIAALLAAVHARRECFIRSVLEVRTGRKRDRIDDDNRAALLAHLETPARQPLLVEIEAEWRALGVVDDESGNDSAH